MIQDHPRAILRIAVDGLELPELLTRRITSLTHTDNRGFEADTVDLEFDDSDGRLDLPAKGAILTLAIGWASTGLIEKGSYVVAEVGHRGAPDILAIRATSADLAAGLSTQRERAWDNTTIGAIVATIADENGLTPMVHASLAGIAIDHLDQTNESSANFLTKLAERNDAIATVKAGRLLFTPAGAGITASGKPLPRLTITRQSGDRHNFLLADRNTWQGVRALYHDVDQALKGEVTWGDTEDSAERGTRPAQQQPVTGQYKTLAGTWPSRAKALREATKEWKRLKTNAAARGAWVGVKASYNDRNLGVSGEVAYGQADDDRKVASAKRQAQTDAARIDAETNNAFTRTADNVKTLRHVYASRDTALRAARAEWRRLQRGMATFSIDPAIAYPEAITETPVTVSGWKPAIDGTNWLIVRVTNTLDGDGGYNQRLEFEVKATQAYT